MKQFREHRPLREKNMENIKHKQLMVPGVAFYSAEGVDKQFLRYTLQWVSTRIGRFQWA